MKRKGTYVLFMRFSRNVSVNVGALGEIRLKKGWYCYVGSAMNGLDQRLKRHLSEEKTLRWHIDYLTVICDDMLAYESTGDSVPECELGAILRSVDAVPAAKGFGCSDCDCLTHLYRVEKDVAEQVLIVNKLTKFVK